MACGGCARRREAIKAAWAKGTRWVRGGTVQAQEPAGNVSGGIGQPIQSSGNVRDVVRRA